jgi:hypothetical protein
MSSETSDELIAPPKRLRPWPSRRRLLALSAGLGAAAWLPAPGEAKAGASAMITRPIPNSGERLPMVGLGTYDLCRHGTLLRNLGAGCR